jgi:hypothetical protein
MGIRQAGKGDAREWSVAFDFASPEADATNCRVMTMAEHRQNLAVQHVDGICRYFVDFD